MTDRAMPDDEKILQVLSLCYIDLPPTLKDAYSALMDFFAREQEGKAGTSPAEKRFYDFSADAEYIIAAFQAQYGIDLLRDSLHWWRFKALFKSLTEENLFVKVMQYRSMNLSKIKDKETRRYYKRLKLLYALPDNRSEEEKEAETMDALANLIIGG